MTGEPHRAVWTVPRSGSCDLERPAATIVRHPFPLECGGRGSAAPSAFPDLGLRPAVKSPRNGALFEMGFGAGACGRGVR